MPAAKYLNAASRKGLFSEDQFVYDKETDTFICPAGQRLKGGTLDERTQNRVYLASRPACRSCPLKPQCTRARVRSLQRHSRQEALDHMFSLSRTAKAKRDISTRQHLMERSFARSTRYGFDRARWRGLWRVTVQEYLVCALQNIMTLVRFVQRSTRGVCALPTIRGEHLIQPVFFMHVPFFTTLTQSVQLYRYIVIQVTSTLPQGLDLVHHTVWATGRLWVPSC